MGGCVEPPGGLVCVAAAAFVEHDSWDLLRPVPRLEGPAESSRCGIWWWLRSCHARSAADIRAPSSVCGPREL